MFSTPMSMKSHSSSFFVGLLLVCVVFLIPSCASSSSFSGLDVSALPDDSLPAEPCRGRKPDYCDSRVANSICHRTKDECYCRKGHVFIKEGDRDTCKTLLTDLRCGIQRHCIHVNRSTCHPGVSYCVCPRDTIYVPQLHVCRDRAVVRNNGFCSACVARGGTCYEKEEHEILSTKKLEYNRYGCACGKNRATPSKLEWSIKSLCKALLVDINEFCNNENFICRSRKAKCLPRDKLSGATVCTCPHKYVPVFQSTLRYYECYPELSGDSRGCEGCNSNNGRCYDNNGDGEGDGCVCSPERSSGVTVSSVNAQLGAKPCQSKHVYISCAAGFMRVCYLPHSDPPYEILSSRLYNQQAVSYVSGGTSTTDECRLQPENGVGVRYCVKIRLQSSQADSCGIRAYKMKHGKWLYLYEGSLVIQVDRDFRTPSQDKVIDLSCYSNEPIPKKVAKPTPSTSPALQVQHRQRHSGRKSVFSEVHVDLRILNINNKEIISTKADEPIKLDMVLRDDNGKYKALLVEDCYASNISFLPHKEGPKFKPLLIVEKGCPVAKAGFTAKFYPTKAGHNHYQSSLFPAFRLGRSALLFFKCLLRICKDKKWCEQTDCSSNGHRKRDLQQDVRVITRLAYLEVENKDPPKNTLVETGGVVRGRPGVSIPGLSLRDCSYSACLTTPQIVIISLVLCLLFVLVCCLIFVIYRKRQLTTRISRNPSHMTNCMLDEDEGTPLDDKCPVGSSTCGGSGSGSGSGGGGGTLPSTLLVTHTGTLDTLQTYSSHYTVDRDRSLMEQCSNSSALLSNSRPDVCTCDHTTEQRSKSMTTSQV